ncbi:MAG TPA: PKD domain-containing protein, partial [Candidatus Acidoferrum sp.]|nr:PKD domain-containing protein [Candidatus Acidoferrum sp.]
MKPKKATCIIALRLALLALATLCLAPSAAFATTNRVGVLTVNYTMNAASVSGQADLEGMAGDGYGNTWPRGATEADSLSLSISGQAKFEVLQTETNLIIGSLLSSSAHQTASGSQTDHEWGWGNTPDDPENAETTTTFTYVADPDPSDPGTNCCVTITNSPDSSGQFHGICLKAVHGEVFSGTFDRENYAWADDVGAWTGNTPLWTWGDGAEGVECTLKAQDDARHFQFALASPAGQWAGTFTTNTTANNNYTYSDGSGSESGSAGANNTVTLQYVPDHLTVAFTADTTNGLVPLTVHFSSAGVDSGSNSISSWTWNFGDGTNGTGQMISHT